MATRRIHHQSQQWLHSFWFHFRRRGIIWLLSLIAAATLVGAGVVLWWSRDLPNPDDITQGQNTESTKIYDSTGQNLLYEIGDIKRTQVSLQQISSYAIQATIAAEDDQFYSHHGIAVTGVLRAIFADVFHIGNLQGGSTITQQLIKNSILSPEQTIQRKVKEAVLAIELEQKFSKDQILTMYLNDIPYGSRAYGIEAASQTFFGQPAANLDLAQATTLAAIIQAPTHYSPYGSHLDDLKARQQYVLNRMVALNMITKDQATAAKNEQLTFLPESDNIKAPHFVFYVKEQLDDEYGERVVDQGGLKVITTLDMRLQTIAENTLKANQAHLNKNGASNGALVAIDPKNGNILAMAGSLDYSNAAIDGNVNVALATRSPGSSIKPFVYAAAFQKGYTPDTILMDAKTDFGQGYTPADYDLQERGPVTMRIALDNSLNIPAVETLYLAGVKQATTLAHDMGESTLTNPDQYGLSLVLGGGGVTLLDATTAYGTFANDGLKFDHRSILQVSDKTGTLFDASTQNITGQQVLDPQIARQISNVLSDNNSRGLIFGLNSPLQLGSRPVAAKTGTSQDFRDGWTMGYTPSLVAGVWTGNNNNAPMKNNSDGVVTAGPIWNQFMKQALDGTPIEQFVQPNPLQNIPYGILQNQLNQVKGKWVADTQTLYTPDCPINVGVPKTFDELHSILYYVRRDTPLGPPPDRAEDDPQFDNWETAAATWAAKFDAANANDPTKPVYVQTLPTPSCNIGDPSDIPKVTIASPSTTILRNSDLPVKVVANIDTSKTIKEVKFTLDDQVISDQTPTDNNAYSATLTFPSNFQGRKTLQILAITTDNIVGEAHRTFIINPDNTPPAVSLLAPKEGAQVTATDFPLTIKVTASDPSGIDYVDVLFTKDGQSGTSRIAQSSTLSPTAANRYEVQWPDSPGPGTYHIYAIAYDKTGNFAQSDSHTLVVN